MLSPTPHLHRLIVYASFALVMVPSTPAGQSASNGSRHQDVTASNATDVALPFTTLVSRVRGTTSSSVVVWHVNGLIDLGPWPPSNLPLAWRIDGIGDLNGDFESDLVFRNTETGDVAAWLMNRGTIEQSAVLDYGLDLSWQIDRVGDLNGDGKADLVFRHTQSGDVYGWLMDGLTATQWGMISPGLPLEWRIDGMGDLSGDGRADLVFRHTQSGDVYGWLMDGLTPAQWGMISPGLPLEWRIDGMGDLNGDGSADLVFRNTQSGDVYGWLMDGLSAAQWGMISPGLPLEWRIDGMGDLNGDYRGDLVFRHTQSGDVYAWLMNGLTPQEGGMISAGLPLQWEIEGIGVSGLRPVDPELMITLPAPTMPPTSAADPLVGRYTLEIVVGTDSGLRCDLVPEHARRRIYTADIHPFRDYYAVKLYDATFLRWYGCIDTRLETDDVCHQFIMKHHGDAAVSVDMIPLDEYDGTEIWEIEGGHLIQLHGHGTGPIDEGRILALGSGGLWYGNGRPAPVYSSCNGDIAWTFTRR